MKRWRVKKRALTGDGVMKAYGVGIGVTNPAQRHQVK